MKKYLLLFIVVVFGFLAVSCAETEVPADDRITLLDLAGKTQAEIETLYEDENLNITFTLVETENTTAGLFIRYKGGYVANDKVQPGTTIEIEIAVAPVTTFNLLDITGLTQAQIILQYQGVNVTLVFETVQTNDVTSGQFVSYVDHQIGDQVDFGSTITIQLATPIVIVVEQIELLSLTGLTQTEIEALYDGVNVDLTFTYANHQTIAADTFVSYVGYNAGDSVEPGTVITIRIATPGPTITGNEDATVFVSVLGNPPTFDVMEGLQAFDYLGNEIPAGGFFYLLRVENSQGAIISEVNFYQVGNYTVYYQAINALKTTTVSRVISVIVPPFDTNYTDDLRLSEAYTGLSYLNDGIGVVTVTSFTDGDTTNFRDPIAGQTFTVRYLGIDSPEATSKYDPWGIKAAAFVREKLSNAEAVILQAEDVVETDGNGRYLAWVWYVENGVTRLLNLELVEQAYAWSSGAGVTQYGEIFTIAAAETQLTGRRIYGEEDPDYDYSTEGVPLDIGFIIDNYDTYITRKVSVTGIITSKVENSIFIEQDGRGIYIYTGYNLTNELQIGYEVTIQGLVVSNYYYNSMQLSNYKYENMLLISTDNPVTITTINGSQIGDYVGRVVQLNDLTVTSVSESPTNNAYTIYAEDSFGNEISIRVSDYTAAFVSIGLFTVGTQFSVFGPVQQYYTSYQIMLPGMGNIDFS